MKNYYYGREEEEENELDKPLGIRGALCATLLTVTLFAIFLLMCAMEQNLVDIKKGAITAAIILGIMALSAIGIAIFGGNDDEYINR